MRTRIVLGLAGCVLFLAGLAAGALFTGAVPAFASSGTQSATPTKGAYCQLYEQQLAKDLHVTTAQLEQANQDAAQTTINQMYADGKITAAEKAQLEQQLQQFKTQPCAQLGRAHQGGHQGGDGAFGALGAQARTQLVAAVASKLNLPTTTLESDLAAGQTIPQIAKAQNVALTDVNTAYLNEAKTLLSSAVSSGYITQDQSNQAATMLTQAVAAGHYPGLESHGQGPDKIGA